jgi:capsule biosynthesis phosphatase
MKRIVFDLDHTLCVNESGDYATASPIPEMLSKLQWYRDQGFEVVISTSRNMRTYKGVIGKINAFTLPEIVKWLDKHGVPYDEIYVGKPWCGNDGFYVDDKAIRPDEFLKHTYEEILDLISSR